MATRKRTAQTSNPVPVLAADPTPVRTLAPVLTPDPIPEPPAEANKKRWWSEPKITDWISSLAPWAGIIAVWYSGILDAKKTEITAQKSEVSAQNERLKMEQMRLEDRNEAEARKFADLNNRIDQLQGRLLPLENERKAINDLLFFRQNFTTRKKQDNSLWIEFDLSNDMMGWRLTVRPSTRLLDLNAWDEFSKWDVTGSPTMPVSIYPEIHEIVQAASRIENLHILRIEGCDLSSDDMINISNCSNLFSLSLNFCNLEDSELSLLKVGPKLEALGIAGNELTKFPAMPRHPNLKNFHAPITKFTDGALLSIFRTFPNLEHLWLNDTPLSDASMVGVATLTELSFITLNRTKVTGNRSRGYSVAPGGPSG